MPSIALSGVRVLDLSRILAAPFASQILADLGAEVIKVERPGSGDDARHYGPPFMTRGGEGDVEDAAFFLSCNRNKRSITIDHSKPEGAALIRALAAKSDVVIENFRTGVLAKYGLDYASLSALKPDLIFCSVTGFGQDGPYAHRPGYDGIFQAMSGMMSVSGHPDDMDGGGPMKVGVSMVDIVTGLYAANAIQAALYHRRETGAGQHLDIALLDCGLASLSHYAQNFLISGDVPKRRGNGGFGGIPSQTFRCADVEIFVVAGTNDQFAAFAHVLGRPELVTDPRFATVSDRIVHRDVLLEILDRIFATRPAQDWLRDLEAADVPASPVNDIRSAIDNPQIRHRAMVGTTSGEAGSTMNILHNPIRMSATPIGTYHAPPLLGEHSEAILKDVLGHDSVSIARLRAAGAIGS